MENMNDRLKAIRLHLNLSQEEFGNVIGIKSRAHISALENGTRNITDRIFNDICEKYNINGEWLRNGSGEMFRQDDKTILSQLAAEYRLDDLDRRIIVSYLQMGESERKVIKDYIKSISTTMAATSQIDAEVESYRHELEQEKSIETSEASQGSKEKIG